MWKYEVTSSFVSTRCHAREGDTKVVAAGRRSLDLGAKPDGRFLAAELPLNGTPLLVDGTSLRVYGSLRKAGDRCPEGLGNSLT